MGYYRGWIFRLSLAISALCMVIFIELAGYRLAPQMMGPAFEGAALLGVDAVSSSKSIGQRDVWFNEIVSNPLFSPDRRVVANATPGVAGLPRLTGIIVDGSRRTAMFEAPVGSRATVVEVGSRVGVYVVLNITGAGITVMGPQGTMVIHPTFNGAPPVVQNAPLRTHPAFFNVTAR